jgi:adenylate cyclase
MADILISYSSHDRTKAARLVAELQQAGYTVWYDQRGIGGALNWSAEIVDAIAECKTVLFLISSHSIASENVAREIHLASEKKKNILPVIIEEIQLPRIFEYPLAGLQRVRYERKNDILHALELLKQGHSLLEQMHAEKRISDDGFVHLAVLPFDDLSPQHDNEWFADGMMDELIGTLGSLEHLRVPSRTDVLYYKEHKPKAKEIAKDLGVRYLVEGSVRKAGEKIRITASLIDTEANHHIWSNKFDGNFDDIFEFQDKVSREITDALKLKLTPTEKKKLSAAPTQNVEAYELYLRGMEYQRLITRDGYEKALRLHEEAIKLDPSFTEALLQAASVCAMYYRECERDNKWLQLAYDYLSRVETITGETARTLSIRGEILWITGDYKKAEETLLLALSLEPNYSSIYNILGNLYSRTEEHDKAVDAFRKALELHEDSNNHYNLIAALMNSDKSDELRKASHRAIPSYKKQLLKYPDNNFLKLSLAAALIATDTIDEALVLLEELQKDPHTDGFTLFNLGVLYDEAGLPELNIRMFDLAIERGFREIETLRTYQFKTTGYQPSLEGIIKKLEEVIAREKKSQ